MKVNKLAAMIGLTLMTGSALAAPSTPTISYEDQIYSFVEVNVDGQGSYKDIVKFNDIVNISINWNAWSGTGGDSYKVYFDNMLVNEGALTPGTKKGTITFPYTKSGKHTLYVELCEGAQCARSAGKPILIADTDGAHMAPLPMNVDPNNKNNGTIPGMVTGSYFVEWGIYDRNFDVTNIPAHNLTHLLYGFIPICGPNESLKSIENGNSWRALQKACAGTADYEVVIHDPWAAVQKTLPGVDRKDPIRGVYGQLMALKQRYPDLKILPSVGGWTLSDPFYGFTDKANRDVFVASMKKFLKAWKFYDGIDIDWEYPGGGGANGNLGDTAKDGAAYVALMKELRAMLDQLEAETGRQYELTSAIGAGYDKIQDVDYTAAQPYMDYIFTMTYDFFGGWNNVTGYQAGIYCGQHQTQDECDGTGLDDQGNPRKGPAYNTDNAIQLLLKQGVDPKKIVVGAAMYGRGWEGVYETNATDPNNPMTAPGNGPLRGSKSQGVWEPGIIDYKGLATHMMGASGQGVNGFEVGKDDQAQGTYVWNRSTGQLVSFDSVDNVKAKGAYVNTHGLGGLFSWSIDADNGDILNAMHDGLNGGKLKNRLPVVNVASSVTINSGETLQLSANASDADNDPLTYTWAGDAALSLVNAGTATVSVTAPSVTADAQYLLTVEVSDGKGVTKKTVKVTVKAPGSNSAPVVAPIADVSVQESKSVTVAASATDADGDVLSYAWDVPAGLTLSGSGASVSLQAGAVNADTQYTVSVTVTDGNGGTATQSFVVTVTDASTGGGDTWDATKVYVGGDTVVYKGVTYKAKWWTRGEEPGKAMVWAKQ